MPNTVLDAKDMTNKVKTQFFQSSLSKKKKKKRILKQVKANIKIDIKEKYQVNRKGILHTIQLPAQKITLSA